ncbi:MAG: penicillin-binding protein 1A [Crocinitomicaceae bacterium]|jgi:penicillin-binding protein 1A
MQNNKLIHHSLLSASLTIAVGMVMILFQSCSSTTTIGKTIELPPSIVYAENDTTILGTFSNVENQFIIAPYFCASLEKDIKVLLAQKDAKGNYVYHKVDGTPYDLYEDELSIYTTLNPTMQQYAEEAIQKHLMGDLQPAFTKNNAKGKHIPFSDSYNGHRMQTEDIESIMKRAREQSERYQAMAKAGISKEKINARFNERVAMKVFSWEGEIDTILTPNDSILYVKNFIQSSLLSIEPSTGYVKAWVGGINFDHFPFDRVKTNKRPFGSTIKSFMYASAMSMGVIEPCTEFSGRTYCVEPCEPRGKRWCPSGSAIGNVKSNFAVSRSSISVPVMSLMGACSGPQTLTKILDRMNIVVPYDMVTPSMCLGTPDVSLYENVSAQATFVNNGIYVEPQTVLRITDREGNEIYAAQPNLEEVFNSTVAFEQLKIMKGVIDFGTSTSLKWSPKWGGIKVPTAGITGTTQGNSDGWFIGLTPDLVTGVWSGADEMQVRFRSMSWGQGARMALPVYGYYMQKVYSDSTLKISTKDFIQPNDYDATFFNCGHDAH